MGLDASGENRGPGATRSFTKALLRDLRALAEMLAANALEAGFPRIGAEQEMFLVDDDWRPAPVADRVLAELEGPFSHELARFNLEANVEPLVLRHDTFRMLEDRLAELLSRARAAAAEAGARIVLTGILPTLSRADATSANMTSSPRYRALEQAVAQMRGGRAHGIRIEGADELRLDVDSVMLESCNTSFQVHLQVDPAEFSRVYNVAQLMTAPLLAASVNSPLLFGRHLWQETRIALFQQSVDTRGEDVHLRQLEPRVRFGDRWLSGSAMELFEDDLAHHPVMLTRAVDEDPFEVLSKGEVPGLQALQLYNSTVYRWNRPCYGVTDGKPHLRIECRVLASGPSVVDEVANAAFWVGLVLGGRNRLGDVSARIDFNDAKANFLAAARHGLDAGFRWLDGRTIVARDLILDEALPLARVGLLAAGVDSGDVSRYLDVVACRVRTGRTGAHWLLSSLDGMKESGGKAECLAALTAASEQRERSGLPCSAWRPALIDETGVGRLSYARVEQFMTTSLFTVHEEELVDMVAFLMDREQIRHVLVEDDACALVGVVSFRALLRILARGFDGSSGEVPPVKEVMERDPPTLTPETTTLDALDLMRREKVTCLPVISDGKLVGIVSERDFLPIAQELLRSRPGSV